MSVAVQVARPNAVPVAVSVGGEGGSEGLLAIWYYSHKSCLSMCLCVFVRERESKTERERERDMYN